jgi:hypothetical protein
LTAEAADGPDRRIRILGVAVLCFLLAAVAPIASHAVARSGRPAPCWKRLLNDWYDGTISGIYPIPCYQQAIDHLPTDLRIYGSARDDIAAARQAAIEHQHAPAEKNGPVASTEHQTSTTTTTETVTTHGKTTTTTKVLVVPVTTTTKRSVPLLDRLNPGNPDSFPLPLLILGALAIFLLIAGGAGMLWQRFHPGNDSAS